MVNEFQKNNLKYSILCNSTGFRIDSIWVANNAWSNGIYHSPFTIHHYFLLPFR